VTAVTQIDSTYLSGLRTTLEGILTEVKQQIAGVGPVTTGTAVEDIAPLSSLTVEPGVTGSNGAGFDPANQLLTAIKAMGGSVNDQLVWLEKFLTDMIAEIGTTITSFGNSDGLSSESVAQLDSDFSGAISDMQQGASSGSSGGSNSGSSGGSDPGSSGGSTPPT
jgi:hypothetical protein